MRSEFVTVVICLYNGARYICRALDSVLRQTHDNLEVVLLDDGSRDGGADLVEARFLDPRLRVIRQENRGLGHARTAGVSLARGSLVAFLDQDDEWLPDKLARQLEVLRDRLDVGLVFTDCTYIDADGRHLGLASAHFGHATIDFRGRKAVRALLTRGCFIDISSVLVRRDAVIAVGGFDPRWRYVEDYDLWLRIGRCYRLECIAEPLTRRRWHDAQFTRQHHAVALAEEAALLRPLLRQPTYPPEVKAAVRHYLCVQHITRAVALLRQRRLPDALHAMVGAARYTGPLLLRHLIFRAVATFPPLRLMDLKTQLRHLMSCTGARFPSLRRLKRLLCRKLLARSEPVDLETHDYRTVDNRSQTAIDVWVDGSSLDASPTGYFNLTAELIRVLAGIPSCKVRLRHASGNGEDALRNRLGVRASAVATSTGLRTTRRSPLFFRRPRIDRFEVVIWRGQFRLRGARRIAIIMDLTTRVCPELHTEDTIRDFERYLTYVLQHADTIVTLSEHSRRDILRSLPLFSESVHVVPVPVNPIFLRRDYSREVVRRYGPDRPYLLFVGTREPRKNLRRLVNTFHAVGNDESLRDHDLLLAGPPGWDYGFEEWLRRHPAAGRVRILGFVPDEHLVSLYHFATAVIYPSLYEGFGLPVLEAMMCAGLVLTSNVSSLPEVLGPGGRYFDPASEADIGGAILGAARLSADDAQRYRAYCHERSLHLRHEWAKRTPLPGLPSHMSSIPCV